MSVTFKFSRVAVAVTAALATSVSMAEQPATDSGLDTIVVTAQRRSQNLQDVPLAVSAFSAASLEAQQITSTLQIAREVPNFIAGNNVGQASANVYYIRGLGQTQSFPTFEPQVGTYVDDIYLGRQNANNLALFGVSDIEVLRGPQGTLFGRNSTGGAIVVNLEKPTDNDSGSFQAAYGAFNRRELIGSVSTPLTDTLKSRTSFFTVQDDGYVHNLTTNETMNATNNVGIREALRYNPAANIEWNVSGDYIDNKGANVLNTPSGSRRVSYSGLSQNGGALAAPFFGLPLLTGAKAQLGQGVEVVSWGLMSNLKIGYESGVLNLITGYRGLHQLMAVDFPFPSLLGPAVPFDQSPVGQFALAQDLHSHQFSQEVKWSGEAGKLKYTTCVFFMSESSSNDFGAVGNFGAFLSTPDAVVASFPFPFGEATTVNDMRSSAVYLQGDYAFTDAMTLTVGGRYTHETKTLTAAADPGGAVAVLGGNFGIPTSFTTTDIQNAGFLTDLKANEFTPRVALQYKVDPNLMVYASATKGFQGGGWNGLAFKAVDFNNFAPETVWSYETGFRSETADHRVRLNVNAFYEVVKDYQLLSYNGYGFVTNNGADMNAYGLEAELTWRPVDRLTVETNVGLMSAKYKNPSAIVAAQQVTCRDDGIGCESGIVDANGNLATPSNTPHATASTHVMYAWPVGSYTITGNVGVQYVGSDNVGTEGSRFGENGAITTFDAGITAQQTGSHFSVTAECRNCTGKNWGTSYLFSNKYWNQPGTYDLRFNYKY